MSIIDACNDFQASKSNNRAEKNDKIDENWLKLADLTQLTDLSVAYRDRH